MKRCTKCLVEKVLDDFYKNKNTTDGYQFWCRTCQANAKNDWKKNNKLKCREYNKDYADRNIEKLKIYRKKYKQKNAIQHIKNNKKYYSLNITKVRARRAARTALDNGDITKEPCIECYKNKAEMHHEDYSKPLDIVWLCTTCHGKRHRL